MKIPQTDDNGDNLVNMSSLLDVLFILIIFFMLTTTFIEEERDIQVQLPVDAEGAPDSDTKVLVINVRKDGAYVLQAKQLTVEEMSDALLASVEKNSEQKVLVRADQEALHGNVARAIALCKNAGIFQANIGYETQTAN